MSALSRQEWNTFVASRPHAQFLQSYEWGEFQKIVGRTVEYTHTLYGGVVDSVALILDTPLGAGYSYLYCPRGPIGLDCARTVQAVPGMATSYPAYTRVLFSRIEVPQECEEVLRGPNTKKVVSTQPETEWIVDLKKTHDALRAAMHTKTRYNIRLAEKRGIQVRAFTVKSHALEESAKYFFAFLRQTATKKSFRLHDAEYYEKLIHFFVHDREGGFKKEVPRAVLYEARYEERIVGTILVMFFGDTATYVHGGSSYQDRELMAPYALHDYALQDAADHGYAYYNFGGITLDSSSSHPWAGITRFKKSFGGESLQYSGTVDYILNPVGYMVYGWGRFVRRLLGHLL